MREKYFKRYYPEKLNEDEELSKVVEGFHITPIKNITNILNEGLVPKKGDNSQHEKMPRVYFTTTKEGMLYLLNRVKYGIYYINKEAFECMEGKKLERILNDKLEEIFQKNPILKLDLKDIDVNEPEYYNGSEPNPGNRNTEQIISPDRIRIMVVKNKSTGEISTNWKDIVGYFQGELKKKDPERYEIFQIKEFDEYDSEKLEDIKIDIISLEEYVEITKIRNIQENDIIQELRSKVIKSEEQFDECSDLNNNIIHKNVTKQDLIK